ncbi:MAG: tetratricopeptide repeat protein [Mariprofundaceae bacterium]|nr:tetratricopeptide repeat protein [Mariprofundaceae bacterium]
MRGPGCGKNVAWLLIVATLVALPATADEVYHQARSDIGSGRIDLALEQLKQAVKQESDDYQAWFLLGVAYTRGQQFHQAMESFRQVIRINPQLAEPHYNLAVIYNELGDYRAAASELERSLVKKPGDVTAEENLADLYVKLALENYRSVLKKAPGQALEQRYIRLLKVRDPQISTDLAEARVLAAIPAAETKRIKEKMVASDTKERQPAAVQAPVTKKTVEERVQEAVEMWRKAWSEQDLTRYFSMYGPDFQLPESFSSIELWKRHKQRVIGSKSYIHVELSDLKITIDSSGKRASIDFFQKFRSNSYNSDDLKRLEMKLYNSEWKIVREGSVS